MRPLSSLLKGKLGFCGKKILVLREKKLSALRLLRILNEFHKAVTYSENLLSRSTLSPLKGKVVVLCAKLAFSYRNSIHLPPMGNEVKRATTYMYLEGLVS